MSFFDIFKTTTKKPPTCSVVIAAAGSSQRCKTNLQGRFVREDKLLFQIGGKPVLAHTIEVFQNCDAVTDIVVVVRQELVGQISDLCNEHGFTKVSNITYGGETRTQSVINGIYALSGKAKLIAIHDGARPCVDAALIERTLEAAAKYNAAAPGVPVVSTLKRGETSGSDRYGTVVAETVDRSGLYEIQTPQIFNADIIKAGLADAEKKSIPLTDDCMAVERLGMPVHIVEGDRRNIKITEYVDLEIAKALLTEHL